MARILVVDDEAGIRLICAAMLLALGHEPLEAADAAQAVETYRLRRPDGVLMDVALGGPVDGLETAEQIARFDPDARVAMLTGTKLTGVVGQAARLGVRDYVVKPFTLDDLRTALDRLLA